MLKEIEGVTDEPRTRRRWFHDEYFDLFVWQTDQGDVTLFQLCYGTAPGEQALVWHRAGGFFHDGTALGAPLSTGEIAERFEIAAKSLPRKVRTAIGGGLREDLRGRRPPPHRPPPVRPEGWRKGPKQ